MHEKYISYANIKQHHIELFNYLWNEHAPKLPAIATSIQDAANTKAGVLNIWLHISKANLYMLLKTKKQISHAYDTNLMSKLDGYLFSNEHLYELYQENKQNASFIFLLSYFVTDGVFQYLDQFKRSHPVLKDIELSTIPYYFLDDEDVDMNSELYLYLKYLHADFIHDFLTPSRLSVLGIKVYMALEKNEKLYKEPLVTCRSQ